MPKTISVEVPTVDDIKNDIKETTGEVVDLVENDLEETVEKSKPANLTTTQKVLVGAAVLGGVVFVVRTVKRVRRSRKVVAVDLETGETVEGTLVEDQD